MPDTNVCSWVASCGTRDWIKVTRADGRADKIFQSAGSRFPTRNVVMVVARPFSAGLRSCPSISAPMTLEAAACMDARLPLNVVAASFAVVPVMPRLSWMTWMASMILSNGTSLTVCAVTSTVSPRTPLSLMSRAISA